MKEEIRVLLDSEEITENEIELIENEIDRLENEISYEEKKLKMCGYGKSDLYYIEELEEDLEYLKDFLDEIDL